MDRRENRRFYDNQQEAQLSPRDRAMRRVNSAETTYMTSPGQIDGMKLEI